MKRYAVAAVLCCLVVWGPSAACAQSEAREPSVSARMPLTLLMALTEQYLSSSLRCLQVAAESTQVQSGDWRRMSGLLTNLQKNGPTATVWFAQPDGSYATVENGPTGLSLADRPYFPRLLKGEPVLGDLVVSKATGRNVAIAATPVRKNGKVVGALGASIYLDSLSERLSKDMQLPSNVIFFALDPTGTVTTLNATTERIFLNPSAISSPALAKAVQLMLQQRQGATTYEYAGAPRTVVFGVSPLLKWHFALGVVQQQVP
ncbi:MAG: hypothetical protein ACM3VW_04300 [Bacteroidota bacterium]